MIIDFGFAFADGKKYCKLSIAKSIAILLYLVLRKVAYCNTLFTNYSINYITVLVLLTSLPNTNPNPKLNYYHNTLSDPCVCYAPP